MYVNTTQHELHYKRKNLMQKGNGSNLTQNMLHCCIVLAS